MIVNGIKYDLDEFKLPTLEKALELCKDKVGVMANGRILFLYPYINIEQTKGGVTIPDTVKQGIASVVQEEGGMLVSRCPSLEGNIQVAHIKPGSFIKVHVGQSAIYAGFHLKEGDQIKYEALVIDAHAIVCEVPEPKYNTDINFKPQAPQQPRGPQIMH